MSGETTEADGGDEGTEKRGLFSRLRNGLKKTRSSLAEGVGNLILGEREIDETVLDDLETALLLTDVGVETTREIMDDLAGRVARKELNDTRALHGALKKLLVDLLEPLEMPLELDRKPSVVFFVGVNGVGKTTTIGKLAKRFKDDRQLVLLAAGDTFRAAAVEQLKGWGERNGVEVVAQGQGADSASVAYDAVEAATARGVDVLLVDTAGRLQAKEQLMDELKKVHRVVKKIDEDAPHEVILVLDGGVGQNALSQVALFDEAVGLTGLVITKLDGTAKAGVIFAVASQQRKQQRERPLPIYFVGIGEAVEDLRPFAAEPFVEALLARDDD